MDHARQVSEEFRRGGVAVSVHPGARPQRQGTLPARLQLRQGLQPGLLLQSGRHTLRDHRRAQVSRETESRGETRSSAPRVKLPSPSSPRPNPFPKGAHALPRANTFARSYAPTG
jgi:hypothetical protein